jgi:hypothetical protein
MRKNHVLEPGALNPSALLFPMTPGTLAGRRYSDCWLVSIRRYASRLRVRAIQSSSFVYGLLGYWHAGCSCLFPRDTRSWARNRAGNAAAGTGNLCFASLEKSRVRLQAKSDGSRVYVHTAEDGK